MKEELLSARPSQGIEGTNARNRRERMEIEARSITMNP